MVRCHIGEDGVKFMGKFVLTGVVSISIVLSAMFKRTPNNRASPKYLNYFSICPHRCAQKYNATS